MEVEVSLVGWSVELICAGLFAFGASAAWFDSGAGLFCLGDSILVGSSTGLFISIMASILGSSFDSTIGSILVSKLAAVLLFKFCAIGMLFLLFSSLVILFEVNCFNYVFK